MIDRKNHYTDKRAEVDSSNMSLVYVNALPVTIIPVERQKRIRGISVTRNQVIERAFFTSRSSALIDWSGHRSPISRDARGFTKKRFGHVIGL